MLSYIELHSNFKITHLQGRARWWITIQFGNFFDFLYPAIDAILKLIQKCLILNFIAKITDFGFAIFISALTYHRIDSCMSNQRNFWYINILLQMQ